MREPVPGTDRNSMWEDVVLHRTLVMIYKMTVAFM